MRVEIIDQDPLKFLGNLYHIEFFRGRLLGEKSGVIFLFLGGGGVGGGRELFSPWAQILGGFVSPQIGEKFGLDENYPCAILPPPLHVALPFFS